MPHSVNTESCSTGIRGKAAAIAEKHGVTFDVAATTLAGPTTLDGPDLAYSTAEARFLRLGRAVDGRVLMVADTVRTGDDDAENIRLISARRASRRERAAYNAHD